MAKEITFNCKFCGETKPLNEMTMMTRFFPVLVACRSCDSTLQSLRPELPVEESTPTDDAASPADEKDED